MQTYNQNLVIDHLNQYLQIKARPLQLRHGYCHGLTLLWLYKMSTDKEEWFYKTIKQIVACQSEQDYAAIETDIEKFLAHIEWLQNSSEYEIGVNQLDLDKILELPRELSLSFLFKPSQLDEVIEKIITTNKMACVSGPNHSIGVFKREQGFFIFDPNYNEGEAKAINNISDLKEEILNCLFFKLDLKGNPYPILFNITAIADAKNNDNKINKEMLYQQLLRTQQNINIVGTAGMSHLYAACENNNIDQIKLLLQRGANPNIPTFDTFTPLLIAAARGYTDIVKLLLQYGAYINYNNKDESTALSLAIGAGHASVVELLLQQGSDPYRSIDGYTYLELALEKQRWDCVITLLKYSYQATKQEIELLQKYHSPLQAEIANQWQTLNNLEKYHLMRYIQSNPQPALNFFKKHRIGHIENDVTYFMKSKIR